METRRLLSYLSVYSCIFVLIVVITPIQVLAWGNKSAHREINKLALELFAERQQNDSLLRDVSLNGDKCFGLAFDPVDGASWSSYWAGDVLIGPITSVNRQKNLADWIIDGGYSADEPEGPMAMRHFYDPTNATTPYLHDLDWINGFLKTTIGSLAVSPQIDAVEWATQKDLGMGAVPQEYSFAYGKDYYKAALADTNRDNQNYGKAWRALGETMHLVADMALAPHVRNDGHGLGDGDPVEDSTPGATIRQCNSTNWTSSIDYNQNVRGLMHALAAYTNKNFFSKDTIPVPGKTTTANGMLAYPNPDMSKLIPNVTSAGYLVATIDNQTVRLARQSAWYRYGLTAAPGYMIDKVVVKDQQQILAPTIVRATEAVIERFLPRFTIEASMTPDTIESGKYVVTGRIIQSLTTEWQEKLIIRNGVSVSVNGAKEAVKLNINPDLNEFTHTVSAKPGDDVRVIYDLGGYSIQATLPNNAPPNWELSMEIIDTSGGCTTASGGNWSIYPIHSHDIMIPVTVSENGQVKFEQKYDFSSTTNSIITIKGAGTYLPDPNNKNYPTLQISGSWTYKYDYITFDSQLTQNDSGTFVGSGFMEYPGFLNTSLGGLTANFTSSLRYSMHLPDGTIMFDNTDTCKGTIKNSFTNIVDFHKK